MASCGQHREQAGKWVEVQTQCGTGWLCTYLSQAAVLDFILEDEPIGVRWLKPTQDDTALASCLPGHFPWDAIGLSCRRGHPANRPQAVPLVHAQTQAKLSQSGEFGEVPRSWESGRVNGARL